MTVVILNPYAGGGQAEKRWNSLKGQIPGEIILLDLSQISNLHQKLSEVFLRGYRVFVAAGGDGTVNLLTQTLLKTFCKWELEEISLGAIGIGSSNDFHKPLNKNSCLNGYPCRLNFNQTQKRDLLKITLGLDEKKIQDRYALLNVSCGITAKANAHFNQPNAFLFFLKKISVPLAILFSAAQAICRYQNQTMTLETDHTCTQYSITNIGIVKSPFFTGDFAYEPQFIPDDGSYAAYVCHDMNFLEIIRTLLRLRKQQFISGQKSICLRFNEGHSLKISSKTLFPFEFDGEVEWVRFFKISLLKRFISCCT